MDTEPCNNKIIMKNKFDHIVSGMNRRVFMRNSVLGLGGLAYSSLNGAMPSLTDPTDILANLPHHNPKVKRVIYLFQSGAPSQLELFDHKPKLKEMFGQELPL